MAFNLNQFGSEIVQIKGILDTDCPKYWVYHNAENDTVTTAGYIPNATVKALGIKAGDRIRVIPKTLTGADVVYYAVISSAGQLTITAFAQ